MQVTEETRPKHEIANMFWEPSMVAKSMLLSAQLAVDDYQLLEGFLLSPTRCPLPATHQGSGAPLPAIGAKFNSMAINVSRLPKFNKQWNQHIEKIVNATTDLLRPRSNVLCPVEGTPLLNV